MSSGFTPASNLFGVQPSLPVPAAHFPGLQTNPYFAYHQLQSQRIKLKRTRQRVDAGEPRNTYSSIPSYSTTRVGGTGNPMATPVSSTTPRFSSTPNSSPFPVSTVEHMSKLFQQYPGGGISADCASLLPQSQMHSAWMHLQQQVLQANASTDSTALKDMLKEQNSNQKQAVEASENKNGNEDTSCKVCDVNGVGEDHQRLAVKKVKTEQETEESLENDRSKSPTNAENPPLIVKEKKARVETIINSIQSGPSSPQEENDGMEERSSQETPTSERNPSGISPGSYCSSDKQISPKSKRKQYQPQQVDAGQVHDREIGPNNLPEQAEDDEDMEPPEEKAPRMSIDNPSDEATQGAAMSKVQELLAMQRQWYVEWLGQQQRKIAEDSEQPSVSSTECSPIKDLEAAVFNSPSADTTEKKSSASQKSPDGNPKDLKALAQSLKNELVSSLSVTVDKIMNDYIQAEAARLAAAQQRIRNGITPEQTAAAAALAAQQQQSQASRQFYMNHAASFYSGFPYSSAGAMPGFPGAGTNPAGPSIFPGFNNPYVKAPGGFGASPGSTSLGGDSKSSNNLLSQFSLVMPQTRKKRPKVTDNINRLGKVPVRGDESRNSPATGYSYPTMVNHPLFGATYSMDSRDGESPTNSDEIASDIGSYDPSMPQSCTLTPMHLRKAKLCFFFTRYPSSTLLKTYFPDIRFNKNNTAQLVKWFSNFREFYYIQMEKYARQALAEGIRSPEDITVTIDSELYKVLNQHYNRNNHIQVPPSFRDVVEATLREFFLAIQANKDAEPSWKKQIYKVIARLDDTIPDFFKNPNFLEQLE